jgi:hypothetical protein
MEVTIHTGFWLQDLQERGCLEDRGVDGRIILKTLKEIRWNGVEWIYVAQDRCKWRDF